MYALGQNDGSALNVPRDDDLGGGDSQVRRNLLDLENRISEQSIGSSQFDPTIGKSRVSLTCLLLPSGE